MTYEFRLKALQELYQAGAISADDYERTRVALLAQNNLLPNGNPSSTDSIDTQPVLEGGQGKGKTKNTKVIIAVVLSVIFVAAVIAAIVLVPTLQNKTNSGSPANATSQIENSNSSNTSSQNDSQVSNASTNAVKKIDPESFYAPVIQAYSDLTHTSEKLPNNGDRFINPAMRAAPYMYTGGTPCYAFVDLANDGNPELVIAMKFESGGQQAGTSGSVATYRIYDLYGYYEGSNEPTRLIMDGYKYESPTSYSMYYFFDDGTFGNSISCYLCEGGYVCTSIVEDIRIVDTCYWTLQENDFQLQVDEWVSGMGQDLILRRDENELETEHIDPATASSIYSSHPVLETIEWQPLG